MDSIIETPRLLLLKTEAEDIQKIYNTGDKEYIFREMGHGSETAYEEDIRRLKEGYNMYNKKFLLFRMKLKETQTVIGGCGYHTWYFQHNRAEIGYGITQPELKSKRFMTEAMTEVLKYGFNDMQLHRIEAFVGSHNEPSLKVMARFGFQREGLFREHYLIEGKYHDSVAFALLKSEYFRNNSF